MKALSVITAPMSEASLKVNMRNWQVDSQIRAILLSKIGFSQVCHSHFKVGEEHLIVSTFADKDAALMADLAYLMNCRFFHE